MNTASGQGNRPDIKRPDIDSIKLALEDAVVAVRDDLPIDLDGLKVMVETFCRQAGDEAAMKSPDERERTVQGMTRLVGRLDDLEALLREKSQKSRPPGEQP